MGAPDRWEKSAARQNAREEAKAPLFARAGLVPVATPERQQAKAEGQWVDFERREKELHARHIAIAAEYKARVIALVHPDEVPELERRFSWMPKSPEYGADFWGGELRRRQPDVWYSLQPLEWRATMEAVAAIEAARPAPLPPLEQLELPAAVRVAPPLLRVAEPVEESESQEDARLFLVMNEEEAEAEETAPLPMVLRAPATIAKG